MKNAAQNAAVEMRKTFKMSTITYQVKVQLMMWAYVDHVYEYITNYFQPK